MEYDEVKRLAISLVQEINLYNIADVIYSGLYIQLDYKTGLAFQKFIFCWYTDRNMPSTVLEIGRNYPAVLSQYMEEVFTHYAMIKLFQ